MTTASPSPRHERTRQVVASGVVCGALALVFLFTGSNAVTASGILPAANPAANVAPIPDFLGSGVCTATATSFRCANPCINGHGQFPVISGAVACTDYVLQAVNDARHREGLRAMSLPTNWYGLSIPEQLFVVADLERVSRGLPPYLGLNTRLTADAQHAARHDADPTLAAGFAVGIDRQGYDGMGGAWSSGFSVLGADYFWMYDDGWGGPQGTFNMACSSSQASGCWAHRDELLGFDPRFNPGVGLGCHDCEMGTGYADTHGYASFVDLVELPKGRPPAMTFTWARNVRPYLTARPPTKVRDHEVAVHRANRAAATRRDAHLHPWRRLTPRTNPSGCLSRTPKKSPWGRSGCRHKPLQVGRQGAASKNKEER